MNQAMRKSAAVASIGGLVASGLLILATIQHPGGPNSLISILTIGFVLGTMFGHASLAATWCAVGPLGLVRRLPLSFAWLAAIVVSFGCNVARESNTQGLAVLLVYGGAVMVQWLLVQAAIWPLVVRYGLRIGEQEAIDSSRGQCDRQFGIRQLMILTTLVAVVLGAGRALLGGLKNDDAFKDWRGVVLFGFIALANAVIPLPLVAAALLRERVIWATATAVALVALATVVELPLLSLASPAGISNWLDILIFAAINAVQAGWILVVLLILRAAGYRLWWRSGA